MSVSRKRRWVIVLVCALSFSLACGTLSSIPSIPGLPPKPSTSDKPTGSSPLSGDWNANTDFGHFSFTVDPDGTKVTTAVVQMAGFSCGGTTLTTETQVLNSWAIGSNGFSGDVDLGDSNEILFVSFDGTYNPSTRTFSGTWDEDAQGTHCSGDWRTAPHQQGQP